MDSNCCCRRVRVPRALAGGWLAPASVLFGVLVLLGPAQGLAETPVPGGAAQTDSSQAPAQRSSEQSPAARDSVAPAPTTVPPTADVATVRVRGGLGAMVGIVASEHRTSMEECGGGCRSGRDVPGAAFGWSAMGRLGVTTDHVGLYYFGAGPVWAYSVVDSNDGSLQVSVPHSVLVALLPSDDVEIALGPTFSWVGAWDPWAFGGTLVVSAMVEPSVSPEGHRSAPSISALMTPLVDTFGSAWVLLGLGVGYDWY